MIFHNLKAEKIVSVRQLLLFLRKLGVTGTVNVTVKRIPLSEFGRPCVYSIFYNSYDPSTKNTPTIDKKLADLFTKSSWMDPDIYSE